MYETMHDILHPRELDPDFPTAPVDWTRQGAVERAQHESLALSDVHWGVVRALHDFFARGSGRTVNLRELHDALDERFHDRGGINFLYTLFPGGPVAQGCRIAGLKPPSGAVDHGFGSVI